MIFYCLPIPSLRVSLELNLPEFSEVYWVDVAWYGFNSGLGTGPDHCAVNYSNPSWPIEKINCTNDCDSEGWHPYNNLNLSNSISPNIRYMVIGGPESEGHLTGEALKSLILYGVDKKLRIMETSAPHPFLYNLPLELIERFREQLSLIDLQFEGNPDVIRKAVWSCYQEEPVDFRGYSLYDPGAIPEPPLSGKITMRVTQPWVEPPNEKEAEAVKKAKELIERLKARSKKQPS